VIFFPGLLERSSAIKAGLSISIPNILPPIDDPPGMFHEPFLPRRYSDQHAGVLWVNPQDNSQYVAPLIANAVSDMSKREGIGELSETKLPRTLRIDTSVPVSIAEKTRNFDV